MGVVFVLDDSGSNQETDPRLLRADAARVALGYLPTGTLVSAVEFANSATTVVDTTLLTDRNRGRIADQIRSTLRSSGQTNYESGFQRALVELTRMRDSQRIVIFLSDGQPTSAYSSNRAIAAQTIPIHTVGYGPVRNLPVLIDIARGSRATYQPIDNVAEASNAFATIVNPYQCNKAIAGANLTLNPSREYKRSFTVPRGTPGISALATWTQQDAPVVWLKRPDGSIIKAKDSLRAGESIAKPGQQVVRFDVSFPMQGKWTLVTRSRRWVSLAFDVWRTQQPQVASTCPSYWLLGSRGSGEDIGLGRPVKAFSDALKSRLAGVRPVPNPYPAKGGFSVYSAVLKISFVGAYNDSVVEGKEWLADAVNQLATRCPDAKFVLSGYSQGAHVTGDVYENLKPALRKKVVAIVLFGDPKFNSRDKNAKRGDSPVGFNGGLGTRAKFTGPVLSYCRNGDVVCASRLIGEAIADKFVLNRDAHSRYDEWAPDAAQIVAKAAKR